MKKKLITLALIVAATSCFAQTSQNLSGNEQKQIDLAKEELSRRMKCDNICTSINSASFVILNGKGSLGLKVSATQDWPLKLPNVSGGFVSGITVNGKEAKTRWNGSSFEVLLSKGVSNIDVDVVMEENELVLGFPNPLSSFSGNGVLVSKEDDLKYKVVLKGQNQKVDKVEKKQESKEDVSFKALDLPMFVQAYRTISFTDRNGWRETIVFQRLSGASKGQIFKWAIPEGAITQNGESVENGEVSISFSPGEARKSLDLKLKEGGKLTLSAKTKGVVEVWNVQTDGTWILDVKGLKSVSEGGGAGKRLEFKPYSNEEVSIVATRPEAVKGDTVAISFMRVESTLDKELMEHSLFLNIKSSISQNLTVKVPKGLKLTMVAQEEQVLPVRQKEDGNLVLPVSPGTSRMVVKFVEKEGSVNGLVSTPKFAFDIPVANVELVMKNQENGWPLWVAGSIYGPASLFWGIWLTTMAIGAAMWKVTKESSFPGWPLWKWMLLSAPLAALNYVFGLICLVMFVALSFRASPKGMSIYESASINEKKAISWFLILSGAFLMICLLGSIHNGLMGYPDPLIVGFKSSAGQWTWYFDRIAANETPSGWALIAPIWLWRGVMLAWCFWIAMETVRLLPGAWRTAVTDDLWVKEVKEVEETKELEGSNIEVAETSENENQAINEDQKSGEEKK